MDIGLALPQYDFSVPAEPGRCAWATGRGHWARRAEELGLRLPLAVRPPLPRHQPLRRPPRAVPRGFDPLRRPRRPGPGHRPGPAGHPRPLRAAAPGHRRWPRPWPPSTSSPAGGSPSGSAPAGTSPSSRPPASPFEPARRAAAPTWPSRSRCSGACSAAARSPSTAATSGRTRPCCLPRPVQRPGPPIWVGGKGDRLLDLVGRHADGWNTAWIWTPDAYRERLAVLDARLRAGRAATRPRSPGRSGCTPWWARTRPTWPAASSGCGPASPGVLDGVVARRMAPGPAGRHRRRGPRAAGGVGATWA